MRGQGRHGRAGCRKIFPRGVQRAAIAARPLYKRRATFSWHIHGCVTGSRTQSRSPVSITHLTMAAKFVILIACIALSEARLVRRDAPASTPLQDLEKNAAEFSKAFTEQLNALVNSKNTQELNKAFKEGSDSVLQQLSTLSNSLQSALSDANGKAKTALEQTRQNLERTAEELRRQHPDVERQAVALRDKLQVAVQNTLQESQKLAKEVASNVEQSNEKLAPKINAAYDDFVKQAEAVQKKLHEAASKQ